MRVKIEFTVAVDRNEWAETYGCDNDAATVRDDVKRWAVNAVAHHPDGLVELVGLAPVNGDRGPETEAAA